MQIFIHHIYEFEKGIRNLILHTMKKEELPIIKKKLESKNIDYMIYELKNGRINIFFGEKSCIEVIKNIGKPSLSDYSAEEDFILGIMLGYDRKKQCDRYLKFKNQETIMVC